MVLSIALFINQRLSCTGEQQGRPPVFKHHISFVLNLCVYGGNCICITFYPRKHANIQDSQCIFAGCRATELHPTERGSSTKGLVRPQWLFKVPKLDTGQEFLRGSPSLTRLTANQLQMTNQRQHLLLCYFKTLTVGPAEVQTRDLRPQSSPVVYQLS